MCFAYDALPPDLPPGVPRMAGGAPAEALELTSADGTRFSAALAEAPSPGGGPAVVILPDVRGLYRFYVALAERFAEAGHHAIAFDYFGRTAGAGERDEDFDYMPHVMKTRVEQVQADAAAAIAALRERTGAERLAAVGFCFGGLHAFLAGMSPELALDRTVGFYGILDGAQGRLPSVLERAGEMRCPVLGLFGGADEAIPVASVRDLDARLDGVVDHEIVVYDGAPHSFFDRRADEHAEASADAWRRVLAFLG